MKHVRVECMLVEAVLVLNSTYEPLQVCSLKRALKLVFKNKAEVIENYDGQHIRAVSFRMALPTVIRLVYYVKKPYQHVKFSKRNVLLRDDYTCQYCRATGVSFTLDHVIPKSQGGTTSWENVVCACIKCNNKKGNRTPSHAKMHLLRKPYRPKYVPYTSMSIKYSSHDVWRKYFDIEVLEKA